MEQEFSLLYYIPGLTDSELQNRSHTERKWLLKRLAEQKEAERPKKTK